MSYDVALASSQRDWSLEEGESPHCPVCDTLLQNQKLVVSGDGAFVPLLGGQWVEVKMLAIGEVKPAFARAQQRG